MKLEGEDESGEGGSLESHQRREIAFVDRITVTNGRNFTVTMEIFNSISFHASLGCKMMLLEKLFFFLSFSFTSYKNASIQLDEQFVFHQISFFQFAR